MNPFHRLWQGDESSYTSLPGSEQTLIHFVSEAQEAGSHAHVSIFFTHVFHLDFFPASCCNLCQVGNLFFIFKQSTVSSILWEQRLAIVLIAKLFKSKVAVKKFPHCACPAAPPSPLLHVHHSKYWLSWLLLDAHSTALVWTILHPADELQTAWAPTKMFPMAFSPLQLEGQGQINTQQNCSLLLCRAFFGPYVCQLEIAFM